MFKIDTTEGIGNWRVGPTISDFTVSFKKHEHKDKHDDDKDGKYGANIAVADIDGDRKAEIIVGAGPDPKNRSIVKLYKGDGTFTGIEFEAYPDEHHREHKEDPEDEDIEGRYKYGVYVATEDIDEDGIAEIVTGAGPSPQNKAWVRIFKGNGIPVGDGFLAYPENIKYGVKVSGGGVGD